MFTALKKWRFGHFNFRADGNGTKQLGAHFWWNRARFGVQVNLGPHEHQFTWERTDWHER